MAYVPQDFQSGDVLMASQLNEMDAQISRNEAAAANRDFIANDYDPTATYKKGDMVIYNGTVQVATVDIPVAEVFAPSHWKLTTMDEMLKDSLATKAEIDGYYEEMTVGDAEQLVATQYVEDNTPYSYRTTGGTSDVGNREYLDKIIGGTVAWNQLVQNGNFENGTQYWLAGTNDALSVSNNTLTVTVESKANSQTIYAGGLEMQSGHKYLFMFHSNVNNVQSVGLALLNVATVLQRGTFFNEGTSYALIVDSQITNNEIRPYFQMFFRSTFTGTYTIKNVQIHDLTAMFGPTIADYIYNLEQATPGAGVAWFRKHFPNNYYPYNAGELISVKPVSHDMVGFNLWDEEWENGSIDSNGANVVANTYSRSKNYIPVIPGSAYYAKSSGGLWMWGYDANKSYVERLNSGSRIINTIFTIPNGIHYIRFVNPESATYQNDICINLSWSGTYDGEYEPYEKHSYPFDPNVELHGIVGIDASGGLVYDGDEYLPDGTVTRKYGIVDLGTLTWAYISSGAATARFQATGLRNIAKGASDNNTAANIICPKYETKAITFVANNANTDKAVGMYATSANATIEIRDSEYTTSASFKTAMDGVYLLYELATPTTETAESYNEVQICNDWGTEEFVSNSIMPVGHETRYPANLRDKLQHLPSLGDGDGEYVIQQSNSQMELKPSKKADYDGTYPDMHVGVADQLLSKQSVEDQVPYGFRQSGGGLAIGDTEENMLVGGTVGWNQSFGKPGQVSVLGNGEGNGLVWSYDTTTHIVTIDGTSTARTPILDFYFDMPVLKDHIYLLSCGKLTVHYDRAGWGLSTIENSRDVQIRKASKDCDPNARFEVMSEGMTFSNMQFKPQHIDLTAMFGSTIADYIYSLEQATPGAGVAWFRKLFPKEYYEYNPGELKSVEAINSHEMVGFNLLPSVPVHLNNTPLAFDGAKAVRVFSGQTYEFCFDSIGSATTWRKCIRMWDLDKNLIIREANSNPEVNVDFEPAAGAYYNINNNCYLEGGNGSIKTMTITFKRDVYVMFAFVLGDTTASMEMTNACFHLVGNGSRNGEYEPYRKSSYPLDSSLTLRGILKLDANNKLYYDGDTYAGDGTVTRRYGIVDLGTLTWAYTDNVGDGQPGFYTGNPGISINMYNSDIAPMMCDRYTTVAFYTSANGYFDGAARVIAFAYQAGQRLYVRDSTYSNVASLQTAMSGVMLVYELAEPTTEQATPYQSVQQVDPYGTEEYVHSGDADVYIPVGHVTKYPTDLRSKIENAPDAPGIDGDYIVRKTSSGASYIPLSQVKELPDAPSTDGTYSLTVTVTNGTPAYSWVSA